MGIPGAAQVGSGGLRLVANRARFRGQTACEARVPGVGNPLPGSPTSKTNEIERTAPANQSDRERRKKKETAFNETL